MYEFLDWPRRVACRLAPVRVPGGVSLSVDYSVAVHHLRGARRGAVMALVMLAGRSHPS